MKGNEKSFHSPTAAIKAGIGYVTEDRKNTGLILSQTIRFNTSLASLSKILNAGILSPRKEKGIRFLILFQNLKLRQRVWKILSAVSAEETSKRWFLAKWIADRTVHSYIG